MMKKILITVLLSFLIIVIAEFFRINPKGEIQINKDIEYIDKEHCSEEASTEAADQSDCAEQPLFKLDQENTTFTPYGFISEINDCYILFETIDRQLIEKQFEESTFPTIEQAPEFCTPRAIELLKPTALKTFTLENTTMEIEQTEFLPIKNSTFEALKVNGYYLNKDTNEKINYIGLFSIVPENIEDESSGYFIFIPKINDISKIDQIIDAILKGDL